MLYALIILEAALACTYAYVKANNNLPVRLVVKIAASAVFILIPLTGGVINDLFYKLIFAGLCVSFFGDVILVFKGRTLFITGMLVFSAAHILYTAAFISAAGISVLDSALFFIYTGIGVFFLTRKGLDLGSIRIPAFIYMAVLCAMTAKAVSLLYSEMTAVAAVFMAFGANLFAFSDLLLIYEGFYCKNNRRFGVINTIMYYGGQTLIALGALAAYSL